MNKNEKNLNFISENNETEEIITAEELINKVKKQLVENMGIWDIKSLLEKEYNKNYDIELKIEDFEKILSNIKLNKIEKQIALQKIEKEIIWKKIDAILPDIVFTPADIKKWSKNIFTEHFYERKNISKSKKEKIKKLIEGRKY